MEAHSITQAMLVELGFLESIARRLPGDTGVLKALADLYTRVGRHAEGLLIDQRLSVLLPHDPLVWYNLGCSLALMDRHDEACAALDNAIAKGYRDWRWMQEDQDLRALHHNARFSELIKRLATQTIPP